MTSIHRAVKPVARPERYLTAVTSNGMHIASRRRRARSSAMATARFAELNDDALWKPYFYSVAPNVDSLTFTWTLPVPHKTASWEYFVITEHNALLTSFNDHNATPPAIVEHQVPLKGYTGRQTVLARWDIGDTPAAFYSCVDLDIYHHHNIADAAPAQQPIGVCK